MDSNPSRQQPPTRRKNMPAKAKADRKRRAKEPSQKPRKRAKVVRPAPHRLQEALAERAGLEPGTIVAATRGAGKPRIAVDHVDK